MDATGLDVIVAEDSAILRDGLIALLGRRGHDAVGVPDASVLLDAVDRGADKGKLPDIVVADIRMPPGFTDEGLRAAVTLRAKYPGLPVLLFSQYIEAAYTARLLADGARGVGYLLKDRVADVSDFIDALTRVAQGQTVLDPEVVRQLMGAADPDDAGLARLTPREHQVLDLMAQGRSNASICGTLCLSTGAVEKNVAAIFTKLDLQADAADNRRVLAVLRYLGASGV
jgi:DNA-binding NarL/FixJ family response regulator